MHGQQNIKKFKLGNYYPGQDSNPYIKIKHHASCRWVKVTGEKYQKDVSVEFLFELEWNQQIQSHGVCVCVCVCVCAVRIRALLTHVPSVHWSNQTRDSGDVDRAGFITQLWNFNANE